MTIDHHGISWRYGRELCYPTSLQAEDQAFLEQYTVRIPPIRPISYARAGSLKVDRGYWVDLSAHSASDRFLLVRHCPRTQDWNRDQLFAEPANQLGLEAPSRLGNRYPAILKQGTSIPKSEQSPIELYARSILVDVELRHSP